jgi:hypothetical protein
LYHSLNQAIFLATTLNDKTSVPRWQNIASTIKSSANALLWNSTTGLYHDNETTTLSPQDGNAWAVVSNLTDDPEKVSSISRALAKRWTPYGAPSPEAGNAVPPFISGFELQAHMLANNATATLELIRLQWGFMLDDPRMTNSTFIEGYASTGELHYAPYHNDPVISFAHGWSTGPTSTLTFLVAGIQLTSGGGQTWRIAPTPGDLSVVKAGFTTSVGWFEAKTIAADDGTVVVDFETPEGTNGVVSIDTGGSSGMLTLHAKGWCREDVVVPFQPSGEETRVEINGVPGGVYELRFDPE